MEPNQQVQRLPKEVQVRGWEMRPPSSYGSMKSDSEEEDEDEERMDEELAAVLPESPHQDATRLEVKRSNYPETLYTTTTQQTKPPHAVVIETRCFDDGENFDGDDDEEEEEEYLISHSPEPPEVPEQEDFLQTEENQQRGRLHPENDLPYIFKNILKILSGLTREELYRVRLSFRQREPKMTKEDVMQGDLLDFVDKAFEIIGRDQTLVHIIRSLESSKMKAKADELQGLCKRALTRHSLKSCYIRKHLLINEGVVRAGCQSYLETIYVEPEISTSKEGGVPSANTCVTVNNLFRLEKDDGTAVRTVLTTGLPGIGMTVSVAKFCLDWAQERVNRDIQFVIKLSFRKWWRFRNKQKEISAMEMITCWYPDCKNMTHLEEEECKFLLIMDSFDCYRAALDWENAPVINDNYTQAHPDVLIVNIIRGTVLRGARLWILGRRAAVSQIPTHFIDVVTEILGFNDEMKEDYLNRHTNDREQAAKIIAHYKRLPMLVTLARQPFVCWMVFTLFERFYRYSGYGEHPPRLTPFYINIMIVQMNRRLQFYYDKSQNISDWSNEDKDLLINIAKMAFRMLEKNSSVFCEEDVKGCGLSLVEVVALSGMCTELPTSTPDTGTSFCFLHPTFQEFMAALYVFTMFRNESKNILNTGLRPNFFQTQKVFVADLVQCALELTLKSRHGHYDMFLRFLCGLLNLTCYHSQLSGYLFPHKAPKVEGLDKVKHLLETAMQKASRDRIENLRECIREMTQEDQ
ncbi:NLR family CARD domain-containing protein 3-like [Gouania willdenowi]|uniref:NLR family CARD domain-containing protein 3-like n=1 Tax=Gouania willdenowi TaxID=441366 RepID=A0A8C5ESI1_GOUWI|nr:NLR family CARD domain-containing protein 3-like [Gouania willdenowi]